MKDRTSNPYDANARGIGTAAARPSAASDGQPWWTTDLSTGLGLTKWLILIFMGITIVFIPLAVLLYFYWKRQLICTLTLTPMSIALHQSAGRKLNPKVSHYHVNRHAIVTASGASVVTRKKWLLMLVVFIALGTVSSIIENPRYALGNLVLLALVIAGFVFWFSRYNLVGFNLDASAPPFGTIIGGTSSDWWSFPEKLHSSLVRSDSSSNDEHVTSAFSLEAAKTTGLVPLSQMGMVVFIGHDTQANKCVLDMKMFSGNILKSTGSIDVTEPKMISKEQMIFCPNCGVRAEPGSNFCVHCGTPLQK